MALITCPECGKIISDKAPACIGCGIPMDEIRKLLADNGTETSENERNEAPFLLPIEECFELEGQGIVVTGFVERGVLKPGDEVEIVGLTKAAKSAIVGGIESHKKLLDQAEKDQPAGVLLRGISETEIVRGQVLAKPGTVSAHSRFKANIYVMTRAEGGRYTPFFSNYIPQFYFRTTDVSGKLTLSEGTEMCMPGSSDLMEVELFLPIAVEEGLQFLIRDNGQTVGKGEVIQILD